MKEEFESDLFIDKFSLDQECVDQPTLYAKYGELHADAIQERDFVKESLDIKKAELYRKIRENPTKYGCNEKPTESAVSNIITEDRSIQDLSEELREKNHQVNVLGVAREAFVHRKKSLENLVELYLTSYFSQPRTTNQKENVREDNREVQKKIKSKLNLHRRKT